MRATAVVDHLPAGAPVVIHRQLSRAVSSAKGVVDDVLGQRGEIDADPVRALTVIESLLSKKRPTKGICLERRPR